MITNANGSQSAGARPFPTVGDIQWMENRVNSSYHSLQTRLEKRFSKGLTGLISYTWGKALTQSPDHISTSGGGAGVDIGTFRQPQDGNNLRAERGLAEFDIKHRFVASYIYELPFGRGKAFWQWDWNPAADLLLGGWQVTGSMRCKAAWVCRRRWAARQCSISAANGWARPNLVGDPVTSRDHSARFKSGSTPTPSPRSTPSPRAFGTAGVGIMRGPGLVQFRFHAG